MATSGDGDWIDTSVSTSGHDSDGLNGETNSRFSGRVRDVRSENRLRSFVSVRCDHPMCPCSGSLLSSFLQALTVRSRDVLILLIKQPWSSDS